MAPDDRSQIPLRARKRAQTRLRLVDALLERLSERTLEDIQVSELATAAQVSPATFFNYFPSKADLLTHFIQLWSLKMSALARRSRADSAGALVAIEELIVATAEDTAVRPKVMLETIAHQARMPADLELEPVEHVERLLFLPDEDDVEALSDRGLGEILRPLLTDAVDNGELPIGSDVETLGLAVASVFFGVPLIVAPRHPDAVAALYRHQLALVWAGARFIAREHAQGSQS
jgi:AcrR family transcriptional regulator